MLIAAALMIDYQLFEDNGTNDKDTRRTYY
jgi:hypothetical protein